MVNKITYVVLSVFFHLIHLQLLQFQLCSEDNRTIIFSSSKKIKTAKTLPCLKFSLSQLSARQHFQFNKITSIDIYCFSLQLLSHKTEKSSSVWPHPLPSIQWFLWTLGDFLFHLNLVGLIFICIDYFLSSIISNTSSPLQFFHLFYCKVKRKTHCLIHTGTNMKTPDAV